MPSSCSFATYRLTVLRSIASCSAISRPVASGRDWSRSRNCRSREAGVSMTRGSQSEIADTYRPISRLGCSPMFLVFLSRSGPQFDHSLPMQEQSGWADHAAYVDELVDAGFFVMGGP